MAMGWKISAVLGCGLVLSGCSLMPFSLSHHETKSIPMIRPTHLTPETALVKPASEIKIKSKLNTDLTVVSDLMVSLANPASIFCIQKGGTTVIKTNKQGAKEGYCRFSDGTLLNEWDYFYAHHTA